MASSLPIVASGLLTNKYMDNSHNNYPFQKVKGQAITTLANKITTLEIETL